jgi:hypothetical protein
MQMANSRIWHRPYHRRCRNGRRCTPSADTRSAPVLASRGNTRLPLHAGAAKHAQSTATGTPGRCQALPQMIANSGERSAAPAGHSSEAALMTQRPDSSVSGADADGSPALSSHHRLRLCELAFISFSRVELAEVTCLGQVRKHPPKQSRVTEFCIAERYWVEGLPSRALLGWGQSACQLQPQQTP